MLNRCAFGCLMVMGPLFGLTACLAEDKKPEEKKSAKKEEAGRKGTVSGVITAKGENWIELKADGEEKARRYLPLWRGGLPADGGGLDKEMVAKIKGTPLNTRVQLEWEYDERPRVVKITNLKKTGD